ncbi:MAG: thermonuclease family protein [Thermodesulfovibrionales bacterium]
MFKNKHFQAVIVLFLLILPSIALPSETLHGKITKVSDGDTVKLAPSMGGKPIRVRLYGIDAPEIRHGRKEGQNYGDDAKEALRSIVLRQDVSVEDMDTDRYGRTVGRIWKGKQDVNLEMVKLGYDWAYVQYLKRPHASEYLAAEKEARQKKLGLWADRNPTPPWEFRKLQRKQR